MAEKKILSQDGSKFKVLFKFSPYFYVVAEEGHEREVRTLECGMERV